jgi:hypothetical protein
MTPAGHEEMPLDGPAASDIPTRGTHTASLELGLLFTAV